MAIFCSMHEVPFIVLFTAVSLISTSEVNRPPKISVSIPYTGKKGVLTLSEDTPLKSFLAIIEPKDDDTGPAGDVECVNDNPYISIPLVSPTTYKVELVKVLDREEVNFVQVSIQCSDKGVPPLTQTATFTIEIIDINDNAPVFAKPFYKANVTEGVPIGTLVTRIKATDADADKNGVVEYSLLGDIGNTSYFIIDKDSGKIFTALDIDRELISHFEFTVMAKDQGLPSLSSSVQLKIQVDDINDNAPSILTRQLYAEENLKPMTFIGSVKAHDPDVGRNSELVFSKLEDTESSSTAPFLVQPNGEVLAVVSLDREQKSQYSMDVIVRDQGTPRLNSTGRIIVFITDTNDIVPVVTSRCLDDDSVVFKDGYGNENNDITNTSNSGFISIDWYSPKEKRLVYQVQAIDGDTGENGQITYGLESHSADPLFEINNITGEIFLQRFVSRNDELIQVINVTVTDKGKPPLTAVCRLNITIDVDISFLTTPKTTKVKSKSSFHSVTTGNGAVRVIDTITNFNILLFTFLLCSFTDLLNI